MNCDNWIDPTRTKLRDSQSLLKSAFIGNWNMTRAEARAVNENAERCCGVIIASISAVDEPYFGGSSASLEVDYRCHRCNQSLSGEELPTEPDDLSSILTRQIARQCQRRKRKQQP